MKPRLIKFSCPACNARLAVPDSLAGMEDNCPKCAAQIKAPVPEPEPAPAPPAEEASPVMSGHGILDAVLHAPVPAKRAPRASKSRESVATQKDRETYRSTLFDEFLSTIPVPSEETVPPPPTAEVPSEAPLRAGLEPSNTPEIEPEPEVETRQSAPSTTNPLAESLPASEPVPLAVPESMTAGEAEPVAAQCEEPRGELRLAPPPIAEPVEEDEAPGLGAPDIVAEPSNPLSAAVTRHLLPSLGVGLMQVEDTPRRQRQRLRRHRHVTGILLFLLFDAVIACWVFRHRITEWWQERRPVVVTQPATATPSTAKAAENRSTPPPEQGIAAPTTTASREDLSTAPSKTPAVSPIEAPEKVVPRAADMAPPQSASPPPTAIPISEPPSDARVVGEIPGKKESSTAQILPSDLPASADPDPPKASPMTEPAREPQPSLEVSALPPPKPPEPPSSPPAENLLAKIEIGLPPLPPPLPPSAAIPEAPDKQVAAEAPSSAALAVPSEDLSAVPAKIIESGVTAASRPALAALKSFLAARTWEERLAWVQKPEVVKAAMEQHYRTHPDGPVNVAHIGLIERYPARGGNPPYCMFEVRGGDLKQSILVLVEEKSKTNIRVDWEAFVEFKDQLLWEFLIKPGSPPGKFRVMIRRKHSFDKKVPDLDRKEGFEISQPGADTLANAFAVKGAAAARSLSQQLGWGDSVAVTVQLAWHVEGDHGWVEVKAVPAFGWRG